MVSAKFSNIITVLSLYQMFSKATTQQCKSEYSVKGKTLKGFTFNTTKVETPLECFQTCKDNVRCQSFNYVILENICELNNRTKEARPEDLEVDPRRYYFQVKRPPPPSKFFYWIGSLYIFVDSSCISYYDRSIHRSQNSTNDFFPYKVLFNSRILISFSSWGLVDFIAFSSNSGSWHTYSTCSHIHIFVQRFWYHHWIEL